MEICINCLERAQEKRYEETGTVNFFKIKEVPKIGTSFILTFLFQNLKDVYLYCFHWLSYQSTSLEN